MAVGKGSIRRVTNATNANNGNSTLKESMTKEINKIEIADNLIVEVDINSFIQNTEIEFVGRSVQILREKLAASVREIGILEPLLAVQESEGKYRLLAGKNRLAAAKLAGLDKIPVKLCTFKNKQEEEKVVRELEKYSGSSSFHDYKGKILSAIHSDLPEHLL